MAYKNKKETTDKKVVKLFLFGTFGLFICAQHLPIVNRFIL